MLFIFVYCAPHAFAAEKKPIVVQLRWQHQFQFAGYYAALWNGYYDEAGLDVELRPAITANNDQAIAPTEEVAAGRADFGVGSTDILVSRDQGNDLVILSSILQRSPLAYFSIAERPVKSALDLADRHILGLLSPQREMEMRAVLMHEGLNPDKLKIASTPNLSFSEMLPDLGSTEVILGNQLSVPWRLLQQNLTNFTVFRPSDHGIDLYGDSLFTSRRLVREQPGMVSRFVEATQRGWKYALENPEKIIDRIATTYAPDAVEEARRFNRIQAAIVRELALYPMVEPGHISPRRWLTTHDLLKGAGMVSGDFNPDEALYDPDRQFKETVRLIGTFAIASIAAIAIIATAGWIYTMRRTVRRQTGEIRERDRRLSIALAASSTGTFRWDLRNDLVDLDASLCSVTGRDAPKGIRISADDLMLWIEPRDLPAVRNGMNYCRSNLGPFAAEFRYLHKDGTTKWIALNGVVFPDADGKPAIMSGACKDITERKAVQETQRLLAHEVDHRARNLLQIVRAMFSQTIRQNGKSVPELADAFNGRLQAMSRAHDLLTRSRWSSVSLPDLIEMELAPYAMTAISGHVYELNGPAIQLTPKAALAMGMVLHELATNAAKYGALSIAGGWISVSWNGVTPAATDDRLIIQWREMAGPPVKPPDRTGFGRSLIQKALAYEVKGKATLDFNQNGVCCEIQIPANHVSSLMASTANAPGTVKVEKAPRTPCAPAHAVMTDRAGYTASHPPDLSRNIRILVAEDTMLIAVAVQEILQNYGYEVIGPAASLQDALDLATAEEVPDLGILDVDLDGEDSFVIADILMQRAVPVIFATGNSDSSRIPGRFTASPILHKPYTPEEMLAQVAASLRSHPDQLSGDPQADPLADPLTARTDTEEAGADAGFVMR